MKKIIMLLLLSVPYCIVLADEGMWLLTGLKHNNELKMKEAGLKIPVDDITNRLSQAIISLNGNSTASFISKDGLVVTNYHCAYGGIQQSSSEEHNFIRDGFWALNREQEIPLKGIKVVINKRIKDVSEEVNAKLVGEKGDRLNVFKLVNEVTERYRKFNPGMQVNIRSYRNNTIHVLYITQTFEDVRLVGAPPYSIAKFGGDTDNWTWPRHGGDFAYLRVYVSKNGTPAPYSPANVVYHPEVWLKVSQDGYRRGDYAMSVGYPGYTNRSATSMQVWEKRNVLNPPMIAVRTARQNVLRKFMDVDEGLRIQYAEKYASSANYCKNAVGMNQWIEDLAIDRKKAAYEQSFLRWCETDSLRACYQANLKDIERGIREGAPYRTAVVYYVEALKEGCEMIRFASNFGRTLLEARTNNDLRKDFIVNMNYYYKDYSQEVDRAVTKTLLKLMQDSLSSEMLPEFFQTIGTKYQGNVDAFVDALFDISVFASRKRVLDALDNPGGEVKKDPLFTIVEQIDRKERELFKAAGVKQDMARNAIININRAMADFKQENYYPDADKSIRLSYGTICDLSLADGVVKPYQTTLSGVIAKVRPDQIEFHLPEKLQELWKEKDFGRYEENGDIPVDFITNGDVTGGNSGSPMLNAEGELIGLVFDCNWESMTRDFNYDRKLHRVICLDVRYMLFITEKYARMQHIVDEILN